ncbi:matrixin family metalloprotease [Candidatus Cyanaurora vandensis]|uniref:matrixin family metalloprotease n=1 Tax=Candidatus Cyanaurora vandensis TaxID=2714958 RepID=UPI0025803F7F|nr:matrixin family metalloprotease [Candidatus Cyanaurora vandensis]
MSRYLLPSVLALLSLILPAPVLALDSSDFPLKVFISPQVRQNDPTAPLTPLSERLRESLRRGVLDWNKLLLALPKEPTNGTYVVVLRNDIDAAANAKEAEVLQQLGFLVLTEQKEEADLVVEGVDTFLLEGSKSSTEGAIGRFASGQGLDVGKIAISLRNSSQGETNAFQLRLVMLHEIGHALGLGHIKDNKCNLMSPTRYDCQTDSPYECRPGAPRTICVGISDRQLRRVESLILTAPGEAMPVAYQEMTDYSRAVDHKITTHLLTLPPLSQRGDVELQFTPTGALQDVKITKSFGSPELDTAMTTLIKSLAPFGPLPPDTPTEKQHLNFYYTPNAPLHAEIDQLRQRFTAQLQTQAIPSGGEIQVTINGKGELRYQITRTFGDSKNNLAAGRIIESLSGPLNNLAAKEQVKFTLP